MLTDNIKEILIPKDNIKTLIITVGNELRGDDSVGRYISSKYKHNNKNMILIDAKNNPENIIDKAVSQKPKQVVIIDAANFGGDYGEAKILSINQIDNAVLSTHMFPLSIIGKLIKDDTSSDIVYLGIQIKNIELGNSISEEIKNTADEIIELINREGK